jgi:hypothetical protein
MLGPLPWRLVREIVFALAFSFRIFHYFSAKVVYASIEEMPDFDLVPTEEGADLVHGHAADIQANDLLAVLGQGPDGFLDLLAEFPLLENIARRVAERLAGQLFRDQIQMLKFA